MGREERRAAAAFFRSLPSFPGDDFVTVILVIKMLLIITGTTLSDGLISLMSLLEFSALRRSDVGIPFHAGMGLLLGDKLIFSGRSLCCSNDLSAIRWKRLVRNQLTFV